MTTITLQKPIEWHGKPLAQLELKEPNGRDFFDLGDPFIVVRNGNGSWYPLDQDQVVEKYLDKCLKVDGGAAVLALLSLNDARALKKAVLDFFTEGPVATSE
jgi:hypothetical protein